jgi:hypothetical protein
MKNTKNDEKNEDLLLEDFFNLAGTSEHEWIEFSEYMKNLREAKEAGKKDEE